MPTTFQALAVVVAALVPGASYAWAFERLAGRWGSTLGDRVFRFIGVSVILQAIFAPATYWFWSTQWPSIREGERVSWWLWAVVFAFVTIPVAIGSLVGLGTRRRWRWAALVTGPDPAPRAWDYLFQGERDGWIRLRMKTGVWLGGAYASGADGELKSYSAGYPEEQDLFVATIVDLDSDTGEFVLDESGGVRLMPGSLLVRWDEVEYLEFIDA